MTDFVEREVLSEYKTIGDQLRLARKQRGLEISQVASQLKVREEYLRALEDEDYKKLPGGFYGQMFFKKYVNFLGLDYRQVVKSFSKERKNLAPTDTDVFSKKVVKRSKLLIFPKIFRNFLLILIVLICFLYLGFYLKKIVSAPELVVDQPAFNQVQKEYSALVSGQTETESEVYINGQMILINKDGKFSQTVNLKKGVNIITVKAKKKYSRERIETRQILVE